MTEEKAYLAAEFLCSALKAICPYDTGNLCNSIRVYQTQEGVFVGIGDETTPYEKKDVTINEVAIKTNEPWRKGHNPNEGWVTRCIEQNLNNLAAIVKGSLTEDDVRALIMENEQRLYERQQDKADLL